MADTEHPGSGPRIAPSLGDGRAPSGRNDPVGVIEAAYSLDASECEWVGGLAEAVRPAFDRGLGLNSWVARLVGPRVELRSFVSDTDPAFESVVRALNSQSHLEGNTVAYRGSPYVVISQAFGALRDPEVWPNFVREAATVGVADVVGLRAEDPSGVVAVICAPSPALLPAARPAEIQRWSRIAAHIAAGLRLRLALGGGEEEAVMEPGGRCVHAEGLAKPAGARERLREAARRIDQARGPLRRRNPDEAVAHWRALVAGRWSIVDRFESDGRRFVVAKTNVPPAGRPSGLTLRERQVAAFLALGYPNKLIAYALGLSESTVETHVRCAIARLGVGSRVALVDLLSALAAPPADLGERA